MKNLMDRLAEPSTWRGLFMLSTALGLNIQPEMSTAIMSAGVGLVGLIGALTKDK